MSNKNTWSIYQIVCEQPIHGVMLRGRLRKLSIEQNIPFLVENASDTPNCVRFAIQNEDALETILSYLDEVLKNHSTTLVLNGIVNPVLSKLKVNQINRYTL